MQMSVCYCCLQLPVASNVCVRLIKMYYAASLLNSHLVNHVPYDSLPQQGGLTEVVGEGVRNTAGDVKYCAHLFRVLKKK